MMGEMNGIGFRSLVAGAREFRREARQYSDDKVPSLLQERKREKEKPEVPTLVKNFRDYFEELQPDEMASIRFYYHKDQSDQAALVITFNWAGIERKFSVVEYFDPFLRDLALEVRLDDELVGIFPEPGETPWFFDKEYLTRQISENRARTFIDILNYLTWPFESLREDLIVEHGGEA
jgi:hypothetical protein